MTLQETKWDEMSESGTVQQLGNNKRVSNVVLSKFVSTKTALWSELGLWGIGQFGISRNPRYNSLIGVGILRSRRRSVGERETDEIGMNCGVGLGLLVLFGPLRLGWFITSPHFTRSWVAFSKIFHLVGPSPMVVLMVQRELGKNLLKRRISTELLFHP